MCGVALKMLLPKYAKSQKKSSTNRWNKEDSMRFGDFRLTCLQIISREQYLKKLLNENIIFEIPSLNIRVSVLEGTKQRSL